MSFLRIFLALWLALTPAYAGQISLLGAGKITAGGGGPASFTFGGNIGTSGPQSSSPYTVTGTFNTGASDLAVVEFVQERDTHTGTITSVSVASTTLTCQDGTNNGGDRTSICYGSAGAQTTATISVTFTGTIHIWTGTGKIVTTTPTPSASNLSTGTQGGGVAVPFNFACTVPSNGVAVGILGDYFTSGTRSFSSVTPTQDAIINDAAENGTSIAMGHTTTAGSAGITVAGTASIFPSWAVVCWGP